MGDGAERVTVASIGYGLFDPYGSNFDLAYIITVLVYSSESLMDMDVQGSHGGEGITSATHEDVKAEEWTQPSITPFNETS